MLTILSAPTTIEFELNAISKNPIICHKTKEIIIEIANTRAISTALNLYAIINNDPLSKTGNKMFNNHSIKYYQLQNLLNLYPKHL